ncbi:MAG TPA: hypothetical protein VEU47_13470 [Candidatus Cybelea sp.]|nr:hypothetical protein [Candidatus Cybelea sp.]
MDIAQAITSTVASAEAVAGATDKIVTARMLTKLSNDIKEGRMPPLIEIKGLGAAVAAARVSIAGVRSETAGLSTDAVHLVAAIQDVRKQIAQAHDDLKFEAEQLGNGGGNASAATSSNAGTQSPPSSQATG